MHRFSKREISGESRLAYWFQELGPNLKTYGSDLGQEYLAGFKKGDPIQMITGPVMAAASILLEGPDQLIAGVVDKKLEPPRGALGRIRRDTGALIKDVLTLHPFKAAADAFRLPGSALLDAGDTIGRFHTAA